MPERLIAINRRLLLARASREIVALRLNARTLFAEAEFKNDK